MLRPHARRGRIASLALVAGLLALMVAFGQTPPDAATEAGFDPGRLARIDEDLEKAVAEKQVAGGVALVYAKGREIYLATAGTSDAEGRRPVGRTTLFRIASMTKPIMAAAILGLVDDGRIKLDDPVEMFLPEFKAMTVLEVRADLEGETTSTIVVPAARPITIRHLLTHTSGLAYRFADPPGLGLLYIEAGISDGLAETPGTIGDNVKRLARLPLLAQPGTAWHYGLSSDVLGRLIEVVMDQRLEEALRLRLLDPLRMVDTHFLVPKAKSDRLAALSTLGEDKKVRPQLPGLIQEKALVFSGTFPTWDTGTYFSGGAGLTSTVDDYARFLRMLLNRGELDGVRVLKPETVDAMTRDQCAPILVPNWGHGDGYGFSVGVVTPANRFGDLAGVGSFGWAGFFNTFFWADPEHKLFGIYLTNIHPSGHLTPLREGFKRAVYEARVR